MAQESWQLNDPKMAPPPSLASPPSPHPEVLPSPCLAPDQSPPPSVLVGDLSASKSAGQPYPATALVGESSNSMSAAGQLYAAALAGKSPITPSVGQSLTTTLPGKPSAAAAAALDGQSYSAASTVESSFPSPSPSPSPLLSPQTQAVLSSSSAAAAAAAAAAPAGPNTGGRSLRCLACRKRVGLAGFKCRCGGLFCPTHRYSDKHPCAFDYKAAGREAIAKANPIVKAIKITKI